MQTPVCTGSASAAADEFTSESELAAPARVSSPVQFDHAHSSATARNFELTPGGRVRVPSLLPPPVRDGDSSLLPPPVRDVDFERICVLGVGSFGRVVLARHTATSRLYAIKIISLECLTLEKQIERCQAERDVLSNVAHDRIIKLHFAYRLPQHVALASGPARRLSLSRGLRAARLSQKTTKTARHSISQVFEYCAGGELFHHLCKKRALAPEVVAFYTAELSLALQYAHEQGVVYRDVKPENCLLDDSGNLKLADFGLAKAGVFSATTGAFSVCGTYEYMAPDMICQRESGYGTAVDWWALGIWMYELVTGMPPWRSSDRRKLFERVRFAPLRLPPSVPSACGACIAGLLRRHPRARLCTRAGGSELRAHPFFAHLDFDVLARGAVRPPIRPCEHLTNKPPYYIANFDAKFTLLPVENPKSRFVASVTQTASFGDNWDYIRPS